MGLRRQPVAAYGANAPAARAYQALWRELVRTIELEALAEEPS